MRAARRVLVVATLWLTAGSLSLPMVVAQPSGEVTVEELIARVLTDNPELRAAQAEVDAAAARVRQAALRPNPMLDLGGQKALGPDNNLNVGLTVPLDLNGRKDGRVGVAEQELAIRRAQLADRERRLRAETRSKAGELLAARRNLAVIDDLAQANRDGLALVEQRVRQGAAPALDENLIRVEVGRLDASRLPMASRVEVIGLQLRGLAGMSPDAPLALRGDLSTPAGVGFQTEAIDVAADARPDVQAARAETDATRARIRKEQAEGRWDASVNVGYQRQDFGFDLRGLTASGATRPIQDVFHYFGAGVTVTLPVRNRNQGNVAAATAEAAAAELRHQYARLIARQEIFGALAQYEATRRAVALYERGVRDVARSNLTVVRDSYGLGRATLLDVIVEQRRYIDVENGYTDVLRQAWDAAVDLERAIGAPAGRVAALPIWERADATR
jgi:cobalt-zinc-cadmium efflux system outer membrane protein